MCSKKRRLNVSSPNALGKVFNAHNTSKQGVVENKELLTDNQTSFCSHFEFRHPHPPPNDHSVINEDIKYCRSMCCGAYLGKCCAETNLHTSLCSFCTPISPKHDDESTGQVKKLVDNYKNNNCGTDPTIPMNTSIVTPTRRYNRRVVLPPVRMTYNTEVNLLLREIMERLAVVYFLFLLFVTPKPLDVLRNWML